MKELSPRQREVLAFIESHLAECGFPPSLGEIALNSGIAPATAAGHLAALRRKGFIDRSAKARSIVLRSGVKNPSPVLTIPVYSRIASPDFSEDRSGIEGVCCIHRSELGHLPFERLFALRVADEAMQKLGIFRNDIAVLRPPEPPPRIGDIAAVIVHGRTVLRSFFPLAGGAVALRPAHDSVPETAAGPGEFQVIGVLIAVQRFYLR